MKKRLLFTAMVAAVLAVVSSAVIANLSTGAKAPNFSLPKLDGNTFELAGAFKSPGKVVVLDIWATWCGPCRNEIPYLIDLNKKYSGKDVMFVGVAIDKSKADVSEFVKKQKIPYTIVTDPNASVVGDKFKVKGIPVTYIIDKSGVIRYVHSGFGGASDAAKMDKQIAALLK